MRAAEGNGPSSAGEEAGAACNTHCSPLQVPLAPLRHCYHRRPRPPQLVCTRAHAPLRQKCAPRARKKRSNQEAVLRISAVRFEGCTHGQTRLSHWLCGTHSLKRGATALCGMFLGGRISRRCGIRMRCPLPLLARCKQAGADTVEAVTISSSHGSRG